MCSTVHTPRHQSQTTHLISQKTEPFRHVSSMFTHDVLRATHSCSTYYISTEATEPQRAHELTRTPVRAHARAKTILRVLLCSCQLQPSPPSRPAHAIARPTFSRSPRSRSADALTLPTLALPMLATPQRSLRLRSLRLRSLRLRLLHPLSTVKLGGWCHRGYTCDGARPAGSLKAPRAQLTPAKWGWVHMRRIVGMSVSRPANQQHHSSMLIIQQRKAIVCFPGGGSLLRASVVHLGCPQAMHLCAGLTWGHTRTTWTNLSRGQCPCACPKQAPQKPRTEDRHDRHRNRCDPCRTDGRRQICSSNRVRRAKSGHRDTPGVSAFWRGWSGVRPLRPRGGTPYGSEVGIATILDS